MGSLPEFLFKGKVNVIVILISLMPLIGFDLNIYINSCLFIYFFVEVVYSVRHKLFTRLSLSIDLINLISFIPIFSVIRVIKIFRLLKLILNAKELKIFKDVIIENKVTFIGIIKLSLIYMLITSLLVFIAEPETFNDSYFNAFYWSGITLTTVGYGDLYPVTNIGQIIAFISSFVGVGIIALPTGLLGAGLIEKMKNQ